MQHFDLKLFFSEKRKENEQIKNIKISSTCFRLKPINLIANFLSSLKNMTNLLKYSQKAPKFLVVLMFDKNLTKDANMSN